MLTGRLRFIAFRRGVLGRSPAWRWVWIGLTVVGFVQRITARSEAPIFRARMHEGAAISIRVLEPPKKGRKGR